MEQHRYKGAGWRVYRIVIPALLASLVLPCWLALHYLGLRGIDSAVLAGAPRSFSWSGPPWYAYLSLLPVIVVSGGLRAYLVTRLPCPRCGSKETKWKDEGTYRILCHHCRIAWDTGMSRGSSDAGHHQDHHHHHHH